MTCDIHVARQAYGALPELLKSPYHNPDYVVLDATEKQNAKPVFFIFKRNNEIYYHPLHLIYTPQYDVFDFESVRGYGGPISTSYDQDFLAEAHAAYKLFVLEYNVCVEFIRFSPILENHQYYYGKSWFDRETRAINLQNYSIKEQSYRSSRYIKKAVSQHCEVRFSSTPGYGQIKKFIDLYNQRMAELEAVDQYLYSDSYFEKIFSGNVELVWIEKDEEYLAASLLLLSEDYIEYHLSAANGFGRECGATNFILHKVAEKYTNNKKVFHLGGGNNSNNENSLLSFKRGVSNLQKEFYIGCCFHQPKKYEELGALFEGRQDRRVIFYRM